MEVVIGDDQASSNDTLDQGGRLRMTDLTALAATQLDAPHYLKSVTRLGDSRPLVTTRDIYSTSKIKLVPSGSRFNSSLYERLLNHKLLPPLDQCLAAEGGVSADSLRDEAAMLLLQDEQLRAMQADLGGDEARLPQILAHIPLNPAIAFKLTVMREQRPQLFHHSIYVALVSCYIGIRLGLSPQKLERLATAGLLHDIGTMHMDPALLDPAYRMNDKERNHLYAHPLTAWMVLNEYQEYPTDVLDAVLQHHERLDGSGYPRALRGDAIGQFGQILALVEVVAGWHELKNSHDRLRLQTILKLNSRRYGPQLVGCLKVFYREQMQPQPYTEQERQRMQQQLEQVAQILSSWQAWADRCSTATQVCSFINDRILSLKIELMDAGLVPDSVEANLGLIEEGAETCMEIRILLDEAVWQLRSILGEIKRRWPQSEHADATSKFFQVHEWMAEIEKILDPEKQDA